MSDDIPQTEGGLTLFVAGFVSVIREHAELFSYGNIYVNGIL
jgi:hypothetical protein